MTRKKVKLQFIPNDSARKATFKKRKKGLMKKVSELSTLCGIDACAIVYSPYDPQPEVWPSEMGAQRVLARFRRMPELEQSKKMVNQESFLKQRIFKVKEQVKKQRKDNREKEMTHLMHQYLGAGKILHNMSMIDLNDLSWIMDRNMKEINRRIDMLSKAQEGQSEATVTAAAAAAPTATTVAHGMMRIGERPQVEVTATRQQQVQSLDSNLDAAMQRQAWFMDLVNNGGEPEMMPFGDANHQNPFWPNNFFP
ncbi:hypothetical protein L6164_030840 [Bauhinia variegata]|uniref:Uncharacterized protein n=1 Tax=Bauhinia variegata TaxID=167791 RepID=A0ACB9LE17_BAUVA|nr:hypothetical protein L6164_030840 [Bauhinia variegata]